MLRMRLFYFIAILLISSQVFSQNECQEYIDKANKLYEEGIYKDAEKLVKKTLETCDLDKPQENELLKLMASIYYELDELELADKYVADFIKKNPYYQPSKKNDPYQFRLAIKKVKSWPRFSAGFRIGAPFGIVTTKKIYPVLDTADYTQDYIIKPTFLSTLEFTWNVNNYIALNIGAGIRIQRIIHQVPQYNQLYFNYEEQTISSNIPLAVQFTIPINRSISSMVYLGGELEIYAGGAYSYYYTGNSNISNELSFYLARKQTNKTIEQEQRTQYRYAALAGIRLMYKLDKFSVFADFRYIKEFDLYNNPSKRYTDSELYFSNNYTLADIELEAMDISVGLLYNFSYKVKSKY